MYFKPRIFISSILNLKDIRSEIQEFFSSVGAEALIYENNLTPSVQPATYRKDIESADFVIFILTDKYGTKTDSGKSGTHEEWDITTRLKIPKHVYIKKNSTARSDRNLMKFIKEEMQGNMISFFYYEDNSQLLQRIKETVFIIAKEIALHSIEMDILPESKINRIALGFDFSIAVRVIKDFEMIHTLCNKLEWDYWCIDTFSHLSDIWRNYKVCKNRIFIDGKIEQLFDDLLEKLHLYTAEHTMISSIGKHITNIFLESIQEDIACHRVTMDSLNVDYDKLKSLLIDLFESYERFKQYIFDKKNYLDIRF